MSIDLSNGYIDSYNFKLTSSALEINNNKFDFNIGQIDADNNRIGSFTIRDREKDLFKISNNNYYLQSLDFKEGESGLKLDLFNGKMFSKYFTINADGSVSAAGGNFKIDTLGNVSISGNITMTGGSISWDSLTSGNLKGDIASAVEDAGNALDAAKAIANGTYAGGSFINNRVIYSPSIYTNDLTIYAKDTAGKDAVSGSFSLYANGKTLFTIEVGEFTLSEHTGNNVLIDSSTAVVFNTAVTEFRSNTSFTDCIVGVIDSTIRFPGAVVDFSGATSVTGLDKWITGGSGGTATAVFG
jgi:hypothetical protein